MPSNSEFLAALFGPDAPWVHVTDFPYDPNEIPSHMHLSAWKGDFFSRYRFGENTNQYFTISNFYADEKGVARRRKVLYRHTPVIVLDDVKEKLALEEVRKLPPPAWILETSAGSEQWGYILNQPCTERHKIENLLDGLVANGLAPNGRDPGMKGVTRYVRLPDGVNTKASKLVNGQPFKCRITGWHPDSRVTLEQLAAPFHVDLNAVRREARVDGAEQVDDHPLLQIPDLVRIKEERSPGRFDITCPWVDEHTGADDSGSAVFTNGDGTIGFKCHHGACQDRTGRHLLQFIEEESPGFGKKFSTWQMFNAFAAHSTVSFMEPVTTQPVITPVIDQPVSQPPAPPTAEAPEDANEMVRRFIRQLRGEVPGSEKQLDLVSTILKNIDTLPEIRRLPHHNDICDIMRWSKNDFARVIKDLRNTWYSQNTAEVSFFNETIYVAEQNQFFDRRKRIWYSAEGFQNAFAHLDGEARKTALQGGAVTKVHKVDYAPKKPPVFEHNGVIYGNAWHNDYETPGVPGDCSTWLEHFNELGWGEYRDHVLRWMAWTIVNPDIKINHMILFGSAEGCGKDWLLYPLVRALGDNSMTISGEELLEGFNDYVLSTKHLHVNETELGDRNEAMAVSAKLKPLAAAPPEKLRVNQKMLKKVEVRNLLSVSMTTNSQVPVRLSGESRRIFALWSDLQVRDEWGTMKPEWKIFWRDAWNWMINGGWEYCLHHLRNNVDLSQFNPGEPPPVTDFLRNIVDASRSPLQQTLVRLIQSRMGPFEKDLITIDEIIASISMFRNLHPEMVYVKPETIQPARLGVVLREMGYTRLDAQKQGDYLSLWVLRNPERYKQMSKSEVINWYRADDVQVKKNSPVSLVQR